MIKEQQTVQVQRVTMSSDTRRSLPQRRKLVGSTMVAKSVVMVNGERERAPETFWRDDKPKVSRGGGDDPRRATRHLCLDTLETRRFVPVMTASLSLRLVTLACAGGPKRLCSLRCLCCDVKRPWVCAGWFLEWTARFSARSGSASLDASKAEKTHPRVHWRPPTGLLGMPQNRPQHDHEAASSTTGHLEPSSRKQGESRKLQRDDEPFPKTAQRSRLLGLSALEL